MMSRRVVGLDIGALWVRAVALAPTGGGWRIAAHAAVSRRDEDGSARPLTAVLKEIDRLVPLKRARVTVSSSDLNALVRFVSSIPMPADRLQRLLRLELSQHAGAAGGIGGVVELAADAMLIPIASDELIHCCVLVPPGQVYDLLKDLRAIGSVPRRVHYGAAAMFNATLPLPPVENQQLALLVDIGAASTRVALFGENRLLACRQLSIGGEAFSEALAKAYDLSPAKAEEMKMHWAVARPAAASPPPSDRIVTASGDSARRRSTDPNDLFILAEEGEDAGRSTHAEGASAPASAATGDETGIPPAAATELVEPKLPEPGMATRLSAQQTLGAELSRVAETLYSQLANTQSWFRAQLKLPKLEIGKVLLCGGGAALSGLDTYLQRRFSLAVERFDPSAGLAGENKPEPAHEYAQAIGLALSEAPAAVRLDLLPEKLILRRMWRESLAWPFVAAAALVLATTFAMFGLLRDRTVDEESIAVYDQRQAEQQRLMEEIDLLNQESNDLNDDLRAIASRLYSNRDLLYTIRALKEQAETSKELWITSMETKDVAANAPSQAVTPRHLGGAAALAPHEAEATIDRGQLVVNGKVKFGSAKLDIEKHRFVHDYEDAIQHWRPSPQAPPLFLDGTYDAELIKHLDPETAKRLNQAGEFPFTLRFIFAPTTLQTVTKEQQPGEKG